MSKKKLSETDGLNNRQLLAKISNLEKEGLLLQSLKKTEGYYDEPPFFHFTALAGTKKNSKNNCRFGTGFSFKENKAKIKAVCEAIERYCLYNIHNRQIVSSSFNALGKRAIPMDEIVTFSKNQRDKDASKKLNWDENSTFNFVKGVHIASGKQYFIPAQMVYLTNEWSDKENNITARISSGSASGTALYPALVSGILEIIERDAFTIHYLTNMRGELVDISNNKKLMGYKNFLKKYRLDLYIINLPTDLPIYTFLSLVIDNTGIGPFLTAGMRSGFEPFRLAERAIEESCQTIGYVRGYMEKKENADQTHFDGKNFDVIANRGLLWSSLKMEKHILPWIKNKRKIDFKDLKSLKFTTPAKQLDYLINTLEKKGHKVYYADITTPEVRKAGFTVVKTVIPSLQPMHLEEIYKCLKNKRMYQLPNLLGYSDKQLTENQLNTIPHFFL